MTQFNIHSMDRLEIGQLPAAYEWPLDEVKTVCTLSGKTRKDGFTIKSHAVQISFIHLS